MRSDAVSTPLSGPRVAVRLPDPTIWEIRLQPLLQEIASRPDCRSVDVQVGPIRIRLSTEDDHIHDCLRQGFQEPADESEVGGTAFALAHLEDHAVLRRVLQIEGEEDLKREMGRHAAEMRDPYIRCGLPDDAVKNLSGLSHIEQVRSTLGRPFAFYYPADRSYLLLNSNDYGEVRGRGVLGSAEALLSERIEVDPERRVVNPDDAWLLLHGAAVSVEGRGTLVLIGPEGSGRCTVAAGLHRWKEGSLFRPPTAVLVALGDRRIVFPEKKVLVGTDLGRLLPEVADQVSSGIVENPDPEGAEGRRGRALLETEGLSGTGDREHGTVLSDLFILRRDYEETPLMQEITFKEAMGLLTSPDNAPFYAWGETDIDGYGKLQASRTEPFFNPYCLQSKIDPARGIFGELDRRRIAAFLHLAREGGVRIHLANPRLPAQQTQFCLRKYLSGECDRVDLLKARETPDDLAWSLGLKKQSKPMEEGRREVDRLGLFREKEEAEVVAFRKDGGISELIAFSKERKGPDQVMGYSKAAVDYLFKSSGHLGMEDLFGAFEEGT